jgi:hypothetical protein
MPKSNPTDWNGAVGGAVKDSRREAQAAASWYSLPARGRRRSAEAALRCAAALAAAGGAPAAKVMRSRRQVVWRPGRDRARRRGAEAELRCAGGLRPLPPARPPHPARC